MRVDRKCLMRFRKEKSVFKFAGVVLIQPWCIKYLHINLHIN